MKISTKNPEFVKRMVVDSENLAAERAKFLKGQALSDADMEKIVTTIPYHKEITWGPDRISMVPWGGLEHLHKAIVDVLERNVPGDYVETGAWRGGTCIVAKSVLEDKKSDKKIFVCDSFEGLPAPDAEKYPEDFGDLHYKDPNMSASLETVKKNFSLFGLLDERIVFVKGWFKDTMPKAPFKEVAILRLDGDMYESTIDVLHHAYHKLSIGGYCIIDDYLHPACVAAVEDFRRVHGVTEKIVKVDSNPLNEVHCWIKEKETSFMPNADYRKKGIVKAKDVVKNKVIKRMRRGAGRVIDNLRSKK